MIQSLPLAPDTKTLARVSLPLMLSILSSHLMIFLDRVILAQYNLNAMNSVTASWVAVAALQCGIIGVTSITEVFAGRHNGAKEYDKVGSVIWQMIWLSMALFAISTPLALWGANIIVPDQLHYYGIPYFKWTMVFSPLTGITAALSGFYIGTGHTTKVTIAAVIGNIVNLILDIILVFGIEGLVPSFGVEGAAFATICGLLVQGVILFAGFLQRKYRNMYNTVSCNIKPLILWQELKIGTPHAVGHTIEVIAWAFIFHIIAPKGDDFVSVSTVCQSISILAFFMLEGLNKGIVGIASNLIGSNKLTDIKILLQSAFKFYGVILFIIAIPLILFGRPLVDLVFVTDVNAIELIEQISLGLKWIFLFCVFDGLVWIVAGIIIAGGDTKFAMVTNAFNAWAFCVVPVLFFVKVSWVEPYMIPALLSVYAFVNASCFLYRYKSKKWLKAICEDQLVLSLASL